jgi:hypothetical protein
LDWIKMDWCSSRQQRVFGLDRRGLGKPWLLPMQLRIRQNGASLIIFF